VDVPRDLTGVDLEELAEVIADAFELYNARGAALLETLCKLDVWHGNISEMRRDDEVQVLRDAPPDAAPTRFQRTLLVGEALKYLQTMCRNVVVYRYIKSLSATEIAHEVGTTVRYAEKLVHNCTLRLLEVVAKIEDLEANPTSQSAKAALLSESGEPTDNLTSLERAKARRDERMPILPAGKRRR
jgi:hypothetical protein